MGEGTKALGVAKGARCCAVAAIFFALVAFAAVGAGAFFGASEAFALKSSASKVETLSSGLKSDQAHLEQQLQTMRSTNSDLGSRLLAVERALNALQRSAGAEPVVTEGKGKGKGRKGKGKGSQEEEEEEEVPAKADGDNAAKGEGKEDGGKEGGDEDGEDDEPKGKRGGKGKRRRRRNKGRQ